MSQPHLIEADFWDVASPGLGATFAYGWFPGRHGDVAVTTINRSTLYACEPVYTSQRTMTVVTMAVRTFLSTSIQIHLGLYEADSNGLPQTRVYDSGAIDTAQTATSSVAPNQTLKPRTVYWPVVICNSDWGANMRAVSMLDVVGVGSDRGVANVVVASQAYGSLPATFPTTGCSASATGVDITMRLV